MESHIIKRARRVFTFATAVTLVVGFTAHAGNRAEPDSASYDATDVGTGTPRDGGLNVVEDGLDAATTARLNAAAAESFAKINAPGAAMAVRTPDGTWIVTIGHQDWERTAPMEADLYQRIGSVTKTFVVTALLQLAERGSLSLDDPIGRYVDDLPNPHATLGQLAAMRSGIPSYTFDETFQEQFFSNPTQAWVPEQLVALVRGQEPMFEPGTAMFYSNTNTVLIGMVIEQVTDKPLHEVVREQITEPLGLAHTLFPDGAEFPEPHARGYTIQGQDDLRPVDATDFNPSWGWAAGAMISNLDDLLTYGRELVAGDTLLSAAWQTRRIESFDYTIPPNAPELAYGLGLGQAFAWYGHTGELPGYNTVVQHNLDKDITLVVIVNSDIPSGDCGEDTPDIPGGRTTGACEDPAVHVANALAEALGVPLVAAYDEGESDR